MKNNKHSRTQIQRLAEDVAYTFKGLYKTSDILSFQYKIFLIFPIIFSILSLAFDSSLPPLLVKILAIASLIFTIILLVKQNDYEKINKYRDLGNIYKSLYDKLEMQYHEENIGDNFIEQMVIDIEKARANITLLPISFLGREWSKRVIGQEMNLEWIYNQKNTPSS